MSISRSEKAALRREKLLELYCQGLTQTEIACRLEISQQQVSVDLRHLKDSARAELREYVEQRLPFEYKKSLATLEYIKKKAFELFETTTDDDNRTKIAALRLAAEVEVSKARLLAEGPGVLMINDIGQRMRRIEILQQRHEFQQKEELR